jgi:hypothetical protein
MTRFRRSKADERRVEIAVERCSLLALVFVEDVRIELGHDRDAGMTERLIVSQRVVYERAASVA